MKNNLCDDDDDDDVFLTWFMILAVTAVFQCFCFLLLICVIYGLWADSHAITDQYTNTCFDSLSIKLKPQYPDSVP